MMLTLVQGHDGTERLYAARGFSVAAYFTESEDGGVALHAEPGVACYPEFFAALKDDVRAAALAEAARRLNIAPDDVLKHAYAELRTIAEPELAPEYRYASRTGNRPFPRRFS